MSLGYVAAVSEKELTGDPLLELPDFRIGKSGVEKSQDRELRGTAGTSQVEVNAYGRVVREIARDAGKPGQDVVLGLDMAMQDFVTRRCSAEQSVSCVLLDALTGDVLALVSSPSYDPMLFSAGLTPAMWQELSTDPRNPLTNKAIGGVYPPGSTFKPVVALAALVGRRSDPRHADHLPRLSAARQRDVPLLATWRARHAASARRDQEILRRLLLRDGAPHRHRPYRGDGPPLRLWRALGLDIPGERPGLIPTATGSSRPPASPGSRARR